MLGVSLNAGQARASVPSKPTNELVARVQVSKLQLTEAIRGVTIGPIENQLHAGRGYGSPAYFEITGFDAGE